MFKGDRNTDRIKFPEHYWQTDIIPQSHTCVLDSFILYKRVFNIFRSL